MENKIAEQENLKKELEFFTDENDENLFQKSLIAARVLREWEEGANTGFKIQFMIYIIIILIFIHNK